MAQRVGRGIALLFLDRGTRRGWVVSSTPRSHFTPGKDTVPILQEAVWAPGPVWMGGKSRPHRDSIPDRPARSQSLYRLSYPAHEMTISKLKNGKATGHDQILDKLIKEGGRELKMVICKFILKIWVKEIIPHEYMAQYVQFMRKWTPWRVVIIEQSHCEV